MDLLIIKAGDHYIRVTEKDFLRVGLDKASVFPMEKEAHVRTLASTLKKEGFKDTVIKKLVLIEEDFK